MVSSHWSNIDPECRVLARCYQMRMKTAKYLYHVEMPNSATRGAAVMPAPTVPAAQIYTKIWQSFLLGGGAARICMKICIACSHVGQMLFAGNKYLLLKRITVWLSAAILNLAYTLLVIDRNQITWAIVIGHLWNQLIVLTSWKHLGSWKSARRRDGLPPFFLKDRHQLVNLFLQLKDKRKKQEHIFLRLTLLFVQRSFLTCVYFMLFF